MAETTDPKHRKHSLGSVAVVGAGASGLAAAYRLKAAGVAVTVFETQNAVGGKIQSFSQNGLIWEKGPNTMAENDPEVSFLIDDLQLREQQQFPVLQNKRYIVRNGRPEMLPSNPLSILSTKLLSAQSKARIFLEPFLWKRKPAQPNDSKSLRFCSVANFLGRHFGHEVVEYLVDPFVAGTSGADPDSISVHHSFPDLWALEESYGSLIVGGIKSGIKKKKEAKQKDNKIQDERMQLAASSKRSRGSFSFRGGMQTLAKALAEKVGGESLQLNSVVIGLASNQQGNPLRNNWTVSYLKGGSSKKEQKNFDAVILTTPFHEMQQLGVMKDGQKYPLDYFPEVVYQPMSVLVMAFETDRVKQALEGFGILVPRKEQANGFQTLGTLFSSSMFPDRAPAGQVVFTTFIGGSRNRALAAAPLEELQEVALKDLQRLVGVDGSPVSIKHLYWERAFPQYSLGYSSFLDSLKKMEMELPGLLYAGNHRGGLAVGKALAAGCRAGDQVLSMLEATGGDKIFTMAMAEPQVSLAFC
ncbi:unnamed protein product [Sphagnum troendelagicum]|uniref:Protoporphyrinogen oxidase n=1 Tax=Sphagnum troendelagicum TaxID=128251 RepID=A0ABP0UKZ7_9BRYO